MGYLIENKLLQGTQKYAEEECPHDLFRDPSCPVNKGRQKILEVNHWLDQWCRVSVLWNIVSPSIGRGGGIAWMASTSAEGEPNLRRDRLAKVSRRPLN